MKKSNYPAQQKDYVPDYTSPLNNVIMETESGDAGLSYRYTYGLQKTSVAITGAQNGAGSVMQYDYDDDLGLVGNERGNRGLHSYETLTDANIVVATWGEEELINFKSIWNDSAMDDIADLLINNTLMSNIGRWVYENINGVYLTYFI